MRKTMALFLILALAGLTGVACAADADTSSLKGKKAPDFTLTTLDGKSVKLSSQKGKVVLIDMWATWCPPCRLSLPHVQETSANKDLAAKGLVVWAVNDKEDKPTAQKFLQDNKYTFTVPMDSEGKVLKDYLVEGIPTTVLVGRDGIIQEVIIGFGDGTAKMVDTAVAKALAQAQ